MLLFTKVVKFYTVFNSNILEFFIYLIYLLFVLIFLLISLMTYADRHFAFRKYYADYEMNVFDIAMTIC